jgi:predicted nucleotidyltransferase
LPGKKSGDKINLMNKRETDIIKGTIEILKNCINPSKIILFGSRAKAENAEHADFDFAVDCKKPKISLQRKINEEIAKISGLYKVDIVYMSSIEKKFKDIVVHTGKVIYERRT